MSKFTDTVNQDTPRLVVMFNLDNGKEQFQWGMVGGIPMLTLVGCITRVQAGLVDWTDSLYSQVPEECDQQALVITWDSLTKKCDWFVHPDTPVDSMIGMLETIKMTILATMQARQAAAQQVGIVGPDGKPMRG